MRFVFIQNNEEWTVTPLSGALEGRVVARVEGACLRDVDFVAKTIEGSVRALWGVVIVNQDVCSDIETLKGLSLGGRFDIDTDYPLRPEFDGYFCRSNRRVYWAKRVLLLGPSVFAGGFK